MLRLSVKHEVYLAARLALPLFNTASLAGVARASGAEARHNGPAGPRLTSDPFLCNANVRSDRRARDLTDSTAAQLRFFLSSVK